MDTDNGFIDPEAEVKKLQDLVKKLEKQNEVLRSRQKQEPVRNGESDHGTLTVNNNNNIPESINLKSQASFSEEDNELVDIEKLAIKDEEDSWLYSSPKPPTPSQHRVSPYKWVRKELDHPSPEVESVKKSLIYKLDEAARMSRSCSTPQFGSYRTPRSYTQMSYSADSTPVYNSKPMTRKSLANSFGSSSLIGKKSAEKVDSGTFTRPKRTNRPQMNIKSPSKPEDPVDEPDSVNHPNVSDIENLAKLQEESLRQSLSQSSPRRDRQLSQTNSIGSESPPDSPHTSNQYLNHSNNNQENPGLRRSYQNVSRLPQTTAGQYGSDPYLDNYSSGGSDDYEQTISPKPRQISRLQPPNRSVSPSVSSLRQPSPRGPSPQRTGLPQPSRRTIPRPDTSRIGTPVKRSGIPSSMRSSSATRLDDSWKEGCF